MNPTPLHRAARRVRDDAAIVALAFCAILLVSGGVAAILWDHSNSNLKRGEAAYRRSNDATLARIRATNAALRAANVNACRREADNARHDNEFNGVLRAVLLNGVHARLAHAELPTTPPASAKLDRQAAATSRAIIRTLHDREVPDCAVEFPSTDTPGAGDAPAVR